MSDDVVTLQKTTMSNQRILLHVNQYSALTELNIY